jgi:hypothetical protein
VTLWLLCYACLVLLDFEPEPPLLHLQDHGRADTAPGQGNPYYLCYRHPRPEYWISRVRDLLAGRDGEP